MPRLISIEEHGLQLAAPEKDVPDQFIDELEARKLRRAVGALPTLERHVICWRYGFLGEPLTTRQVARRLNMSPARVWKLEQRGLTQLRRSFAGEIPDVIPAAA